MTKRTKTVQRLNEVWLFKRKVQQLLLTYAKKSTNPGKMAGPIAGLIPHANERDSILLLEPILIAVKRSAEKPDFSLLGTVLQLL
jgi:hypothetical protein